MTSPRLVTVFGATGNQGGAVVKSLLQNKAAFKVRGITRNPESERAQALTAAGVEVVKADGFKKEELRAALDGSWAVFANTNTDDPVFENLDGPTEYDLGTIIVDAAASAGVKYFVYSSAAPVSEITGGEVKLGMMDNKHGVERYARQNPAFSGVVAVNAGWYYENFLVPFISELQGGFPLTEDAEGYYTFVNPAWGGDGKVQLIAIENDYGDLVHGVLLEPDRWAGKMVQAYSEALTFQDIADAFTRVTGKKARIQTLPSWKDFPTMGGIPSLVNIQHMFAFTQHFDGKYYGQDTNHEDAVQLKKSVKAAIEAQAGNHAGELLTMESFFRNTLAG